MVFETAWSKEREDENIRMTAISLLARVVPRIKDKLEEAVDVVHRVGKQRSDGSPRHIIIRFVTRRHRNIIWMEAKSSIYLRENGLHIKEFLSKADIESRNKLWPLRSKHINVGPTWVSHGQQGYRVGMGSIWAS